jgi:hypothetical protein
MKMYFPEAMLFLLFCQITKPALPAESAELVSEAAAQAFLDKVNDIEAYAAGQGEGEKTTRFTEQEINSYLSLHGDSKYRSCVQYFKISLAEESLEGTASVNFDCLRETSPGPVSGLITGLFSGIHTLTARGNIQNDNGTGNFRLEEARFDSVPLPGFLVEQMITGICMRLDPPFDPMEPSPFPHKIRSIHIEPGQIMVLQ